MNGRSQLLGLALASLVSFGPGCGVQQRAAEKLIDPQLRSEGVLVERQRGRRDLELGRYRVEELELVDETFDGSGPLAPDADGRTRPTEQLRMSFTLAGGAQPWTAECVGQRRQPPDHDLAVLAGELRDEVAVHCQLAGGESRWVLRVEGPLTNNLLGRVYAAGEAEPGELGEVGELGQLGEGGPGRVVEVVMWYQLWNFTRRHLPASLVVIRGDEGTEAALILDAPERAWLDAALDDSGRELALTTMLALRLLPLGFDG
ncbi:hypothetical protein [Enhygromyxa salina]|uniref:hypothetical protein n=1 Tax=Enhygromyxa salina TaxID=215803 RepID=UPI0011B1D5C0|nr:hypothetical protein [Enhygromyxa salina]